MKTPTDDEVKKYDEMIAAIAADRSRGVDTTEAENELHAYMIKTGIAEEAPVSDFPELADRLNDDSADTTESESSL